VNTSFNVRGEPIVCTPEDAYRCFMRTHIDSLVLGPFLLEKASQTEWKEDDDMAARVPARLTAAEGRKFGFTVGRVPRLRLDRALARQAAHGDGAARARRRARRRRPRRADRSRSGRARVDGLAHRHLEGDDADLHGHRLFLVILPIGLVRRLNGSSPILPRARAASRWEAHEPAVADGARMERQF
jgi:hypothetical protein